MHNEIQLETQGDIQARLDLAPVVLGAVAGTVSTDMDVLTGTVAGCLVCDFTRDDAKS
jgi:hypothetical protein